MPVTTQDSTQIANGNAFPPVINPASEDGGRIRVKYFNFTQSGIGDATSIANLARLPGGKLRVLQIAFTSDAMGASRTLDFGHGGYTDSDGNAVAADEDYFGANRDVSAATTDFVFAFNADMDTPAGFVLTGQVNDGTIPDAVRIRGYIQYAVD